MDEERGGDDALDTILHKNNNSSCDDIGWVSNILARNGLIVLVFYTR